MDAARLLIIIQPSVPPRTSPEVRVWRSAFPKTAGMAFRCVPAKFKHWLLHDNLCIASNSLSLAVAQTLNCTSLQTSHSFPTWLGRSLCILSSTISPPFLNSSAGIPLGPGDFIICYLPHLWLMLLQVAVEMVLVAYAQTAAS